MQVTTLLLCGALRVAAAFTPKTTIRVKCPALQAQQDDESRSRRGRRRERKKDAVAIDAPAVDAPRKQIKRPAFLEKKPRRKASTPKPEAPVEPTEEVDFASQCRDQLIQLYERYNPEKVDEVDTLLTKWPGREAQLLSAVEAKYSREEAAPASPAAVPKPADVLAAVMGDAGRTKSPTPERMPREIIFTRDGTP